MSFQNEVFQHVWRAIIEANKKFFGRWESSFKWQNELQLVMGNLFMVDLGKVRNKNSKVSYAKETSN